MSPESLQELEQAQLQRVLGLVDKAFPILTTGKTKLKPKELQAAEIFGFLRPILVVYPAGLFRHLEFVKSRLGNMINSRLEIIATSGKNVKIKPLMVEFGLPFMAHHGCVHQGICIYPDGYRAEAMANLVQPIRVFSELGEPVSGQIVDTSFGIS